MKLFISSCTCYDISISVLLFIERPFGHFPRCVHTCRQVLKTNKFDISNNNTDKTPLASKYVHSKILGVLYV